MALYSKLADRRPSRSAMDDGPQAVLSDVPTSNGFQFNNRERKMRIAAGVFLLIAAVFNGCAGITWLGAGGVSAAVGKAAENPDSLKAEDGTKIELTAETKEAAADMKSKGGNWMMLAIFVLVVMGLQIGGGVVLFMNKAATFVLIVGVLGIGAEVWGGLNSAFGIANAPGIVASILAIVAALGMKKSAGTPAA